MVADIACLAPPEIIAEKLRVCYRRNKARDIHDLGVFAARPLDQPLVRRLVVLKLWQAHDTFDPTRLMQKFKDGRDIDWDDLRHLLNRAAVIDHDRITADCLRGFGFLAELTPVEQVLSNDKHQRERALAEDLRSMTARGSWNGPNQDSAKANRQYLGTLGIENGLIVFVTSGTVVPVKASVTVELIS